MGINPREIKKNFLNAAASLTSPHIVVHVFQSLSTCPTTGLASG